MGVPAHIYIYDPCVTHGSRSSHKWGCSWIFQISLGDIGGRSHLSGMHLQEVLVGSQSSLSDVECML